MRNLKEKFESHDINFLYLSLMETLLSQIKLCLFGGQLCQLLPLLFTGTFSGQTVASVQISQLDCKIKLVFRI